MITDMDAARLHTHSLKNARVLRILGAALEAVDPYQAVQTHLPALTGAVHGLGIGKASIPMLAALAETYPLSSALAISKHASLPPPSLFPVFLGDHPVPGVGSLRAGERVLDFVSAVPEGDTLVCLLSGGGSALVTAPRPGITLEDMQVLTALLLARGATINELNTLRRSLDRVKGGGLARATRAKIVSLILSDVIGNPLETIASGPTAPNSTTNADALAILEKYVPAADMQSYREATHAITQYLRSSQQVQANNFDASRVQNLIIGDNQLAAQAAMEQARREGFDVELLTNELQGEAREVGVMLARRLRTETENRPRPFCLIAGGETTVTLKGNGKGGRNQELALAAVAELADTRDGMLIALATDGDDGPTDAAGAVVTGDTHQRGERLELDATDYLSRNDAYHYFDALGDLLKPGPTGTNVNDLVFLFGLDPATSST